MNLLDRAQMYLDSHPNIKRSFLTEEYDGLIWIAIAIRGIGVCGITCPAEKWNPQAMMELVEKHAS